MHRDAILAQEATTMYYTVTEGRARLLERLNLRDRSTYGVDWMVLDASHARDAVRQWGSFKAGTHPLQGALEAQAASYRTSVPGYVPAWNAESEIVSSDIDRTLGALDEQRRELDELQARLRAVRSTVLGGAGPRRRPRRARPGRGAARGPGATPRRRAA
jgi:hypothetical protein